MTNDDESLLSALNRSLESTPRLPRDDAMVRLARHYAGLMDDAFDRLDEADEEGQAANLARMATLIAKIGPRYEATLDKMGMSPGARPARPGGEAGGDPSAEALASLERDAAAGAPTSGIDYAAAVDPAVTEADAAD